MKSFWEKTKQGWLAVGCLIAALPLFFADMVFGGRGFFYGDYRIINWNPSAYRHEIRAIRLQSDSKAIHSYGDAQGFRGRPKGIQAESFEKLRVLRANARIFHYGWVRPPEVMKAKTEAFDRLYHQSEGATGDNYKYKRIFGLERFTGSHPLVMRDRVDAHDWSEALMSQALYFHWKDIRKVGARLLEKFFGIRVFEYRNYLLTK